MRHLVQEQQAAAVLMAYGISAAGKTYTIEGTRSEPGVLPRALHLLFQVTPVPQLCCKDELSTHAQLLLSVHDLVCFAIVA